MARFWDSLKNKIKYKKNKWRRRFLRPPATVEYVIDPSEIPSNDLSTILDKVEKGEDAQCAAPDFRGG